MAQLWPGTDLAAPLRLLYIILYPVTGLNDPTETLEAHQTLSIIRGSMSCPIQALSPAITAAVEAGLEASVEDGFSCLRQLEEGVVCY